MQTGHCNLKHSTLSDSNEQKRPCCFLIMVCSVGNMKWVQSFLSCVSLTHLPQRSNDSGYQTRPQDYWWKSEKPELQWYWITMTLSGCYNADLFSTVPTTEIQINVTLRVTQTTLKLFAELWQWPFFILSFTTNKYLLRA